jgi:hypothetical protein
MQTLIFILVAYAASVAALRIYKSYKKDNELRAHLEKIEEEKFQAELQRSRLPKLERGVLGDVVMRVNPLDRYNYHDSNITRSCSLGYQSSWGFYGIGPHVMAEDILFHFTSDQRFAQWGEPKRAMVEELICFVPLDGGTIKCEQIKAIVARYWDKFELEVKAMNENRAAHGLRANEYVHTAARPNFLEPASRSVQAKGHKCS